MGERCELQRTAKCSHPRKDANYKELQSARTQGKMRTTKNCKVLAPKERCEQRRTAKCSHPRKDANNKGLQSARTQGKMRAIENCTFKGGGKLISKDKSAACLWKGPLVACHPRPPGPVV